MWIADWCNALFSGHDKADILERLKKEAQQWQNIDSKQIEELLDVLPQQVDEAAQILRVSVTSKEDLSSILSVANLKLVEDNIGYQELTWRLQRTLKERDEYSEKLNQELNIAREIQQSLQPKLDDEEGVDAINIPATHLSGDFYDYFYRDDGRICFCLGDVSGKGAYAALLMSKTISLFRCMCRVDDNFEEIVQLINDEICETSTRGLFVTLIAGWLDPETGDMQVINAGHLPGIMVSSKGIQKIDAMGPPLGVLEGASYASEHYPFQRAKLFLYTDGLTEAHLKTGGELGEKGLLQWLLKSINQTLAEQIDYVQQQFDELIVEQTDDITLMVLSG
nr:SpoIIE family protein phosphatase [Pleionea sp. CnH1-48]